MNDAKSRLRLVIGEEGVARLEAATVVVFGVGGVGASCAEALVRGGVGGLVFVDGDEVQLSNVNRQAIAFRSTVGRRKVEVMRAMALDINPDARVIIHDAFVLPEDVPAIIEHGPRPDYLVDTVDTVVTKLALALYAQEHGIPLISSMGAANKTDPTRLRFSNLYDTQGCPLCRAMRKQARTKGIERLQVLYSDEAPQVVMRPVADGGEGEGAQSRTGAPRGRENLGSMSYFPPVMGQMIAGYVIQELLRD